MKRLRMFANKSDRDNELCGEREETIVKGIVEKFIFLTQRHVIVPINYNKLFLITSQTSSFHF
jgi:hypothetical protein